MESLARRTERVALGAVFIGAALVVATVIVRVLTGGLTVSPAGYACALLIATLVIEGGRAFVLRRVGRRASSDALLADATNRVSDVLAPVGVLAGLAGLSM